LHSTHNYFKSGLWQAQELPSNTGDAYRPGAPEGKLVRHPR
jgi:hypothetical protein